MPLRRREPPPEQPRPGENRHQRALRRQRDRNPGRQPDDSWSDEHCNHKGFGRTPAPRGITLCDGCGNPV